MRGTTRIGVGREVAAFFVGLVATALWMFEAVGRAIGGPAGLGSFICPSCYLGSRLLGAFKGRDFAFWLVLALLVLMNGFIYASVVRLFRLGRRGNRGALAGVAAAILAWTVYFMSLGRRG